MANKKRQPLRQLADLSAEDIKRIRAMRRRGDGYVYLSRLFKVSAYTICKIEQANVR